jgi:UDP-N-acetylmuramoylalanine--D-glutamate ligase
MTGRSWAGRRICVAGLGVSGAAAARALLDRAADVVAVDARDDDRVRGVAAELHSRGAGIRLGDAETPVDAELVVTSPGWRPTQPLLVAAQQHGVEVIGEPELAWRLHRSERSQQSGPELLGVTGTNGKTTTVGMLASILSAAGYRTIAAGNVGVPLVDVVLSDPPYDVIAVELSSFQLHWSSSLQFHASTVLNVAPDHLDWHGSMEAYAADKAKIWGGGASAVFNDDDEWSRRLASGKPDTHGFSVLSTAAQFRVEDARLVDGMDGTALADVADLHLTGLHNVANALAAAALARLLNLREGFDVSAEAVAAGLSRYHPGPHRNTTVATVHGVTYVDDSKATNPHAAAASLSAYDNVVWIAGGLLKGADVDDLVAAQHSRLRGVVLIGADRERIRDALVRHAPDVPVEEVDATDTGAMTAAVRVAGHLALPGDTVLLAPSAASMDMFRDYAERGDVFAAAVRKLAEDRA